MANSTVRNPIYIDTFNADFTISTSPITVKKIRMKTAADGDIFVLEDKHGNHVVWLVTEANGDPVEVDFPAGCTFDGLRFDADDGNSGLGTNDLVWIYKA